MARSTHQDTRNALLQAAQRLIAERGLATVSVKDITRAAGARNPSAVHYHFGNVEELIKEVFTQRYRAIEQERALRLAKVDETDPVRRLVALMAAAISPFMESSLDEEGRLYVRFCLQFSSDPRFNLLELVTQHGMPSLISLRAQLVACVPDVPEGVLNARLRQAFSISLMQAADYARQLEAGLPITADTAVREASATLAGYIAAKVV
ncbi:TetR family transcriptional regulator [Novosphingobium sp.]|uniref:TetR family transcriptional regulator n=1 Tax=Novosphingobium sp. TaxID=1874826 RepID=UPI001D5282FE|nr:TetR family transcriptional regulator [Novosphingobium sp.]MBX9662802.1 TetR family transcriptional regulator [Novosphingobium sp.]